MSNARIKALEDKVDQLAAAVEALASRLTPRATNPRVRQDPELTKRNRQEAVAKARAAKKVGEGRGCVGDEHVRRRMRKQADDSTGA